VRTDAEGVRPDPAIKKFLPLATTNWASLKRRLRNSELWLSGPSIVTEIAALFGERVARMEAELPGMLHNWRRSHRIVADTRDLAWRDAAIRREDG
jgi:hypothetical protein